MTRTPNGNDPETDSEPEFTEDDLDAVGGLFGNLEDLGPGWLTQVPPPPQLEKYPDGLPGYTG